MNAENVAEVFGKELERGFGALFIGAGISAPSGLPNWADLLSSPVKRNLLLDLQDTDDLVQLAQYIVNRNVGNRGSLVQHLKRALTGPFSPNPYHQALVLTNVFTIWTTNFDTLLEQAFREHFAVDVKATDDSIARSVPNYQMEILKMHGSIDSSPQDELVITSEDYEDFFNRRPATAQRLRSDLLNKSFLFLGYSYRDPNIRNVIVEARRLAGHATRPHYLITERAKGDRGKLLQKLWCHDLLRLGIECAVIDDYGQLRTALDVLARHSRGQTVYSTGSHLVERLALARDIGRLLALEKDLIVIDGQSAGASREFVSGFTESAAGQKLDISTRLRIFPNPYANTPQFESDATLIPVLKQWRAPLMRATHTVLVFDGRMGTKAEVELAEQCRCIIIPIPTGPNGFTRELLKRPSVVERLPKEYMDVCESSIPTAEAVVNCIKNTLRVEQ